MRPGEIGKSTRAQIVNARIRIDTGEAACYCRIWAAAVRCAVRFAMARALLLI